MLPLLQPGKVDKRTGDPEAGGKTSGQKAVRKCIRVFIKEPARIQSVIPIM